MSTAPTPVQELCECQLQISDDIRLCKLCHRYSKGKREYVSVSKVIRTVYPTDWSAIDPEVLEHARVRGERVDAYFCEYLKSGNVTLQPGEWSEVKDYLDRLIQWAERERLQPEALQEIVYSDADGVAGTLDIRDSGAILDLKCVSSLQPGYALQLGAYAEYNKDTHTVGIIHVTKQKVQYVKYDALKCRQQWR